MLELMQVSEAKIQFSVPQKVRFIKVLVENLSDAHDLKDLQVIATLGN